ncbi:hypothetical protein RIF29_03555 [Crotalaria pallida]|uniref:Uncharacterized protein n=1 Tax=Crotalaria pallida TaxID=3830 RepID=A0AAN9J092_CROPI
MAPSGRTAAAAAVTNSKTTTTTTTNSKTTTTKTRRRTRQPRKTNFKKQHTKSKKQEMPTVFPSSSSSQDSSKEGENEVCEVIDVSSSSACSTPKGQKFRLPEISTCPPAPKKPRVLSSNCSLRRSSLSFFSPPDLEQFFFVALRDVSV